MLITLIREQEKKSTHMREWDLEQSALWVPCVCVCQYTYKYVYFSFRKHLGPRNCRCFYLVWDKSNAKTREKEQNRKTKNEWVQCCIILLRFSPNTIVFHRPFFGPHIPKSTFCYSPISYKYIVDDDDIDDENLIKELSNFFFHVYYYLFVYHKTLTV